jgi:hypothetical protein
MGFAYGQGLRNGRDFGAWLSRILDFFVNLFRPGKAQGEIQEGGASFNTKKTKPITITTPQKPKGRRR